MKLLDLKGALIQQFFKTKEGVDEIKISEVIASLGLKLQEDTSYFQNISDKPVHSHEPSKAFAKFMSGNRSLLLIEEEEEPFKKIIIYGAIRSGKQVISVNLTDDSGPQISSLLNVKEALKQALAINDEICYSIFTENKSLLKL